MSFVSPLVLEEQQISGNNGYTDRAMVMDPKVRSGCNKCLATPCCLPLSKPIHAFQETYVRSVANEGLSIAQPSNSHVDMRLKLI